MKLEKEEQIKPKASRRKEIRLRLQWKLIKERLEKQWGKFYKVRNWFFYLKNEQIDKPLLDRQRRRGEQKHGNY